MTDRDMTSFFQELCGRRKETLSSGDEIEDDDAVGLSHVGVAAYDVLRKSHNWHHHSCWNVTTGRVVGELDQTPRNGWALEDEPPKGHDDWFPQKMGDILAKTEVFADVMSLGPPDGLFMKHFNRALHEIAAKELDNTVRIRMMFGNIVGMPVNCTQVIKDLTKGLDSSTCGIQLWVGAWRRGVSWNHAKIIAIDGQHLHTGGHNLWDYHYLKNNPVHDLSLELDGRVAHDGHLFANEQWAFIESKQNTIVGGCIDKMPDFLPMVTKNRVTVSEFPVDKAPVFPPKYRKVLVPKRVKHDHDVPIITMGRYGTLLFRSRPSDDAFWAMLESAQHVIRLALQDLGPVCIPGSKIALPGCMWPHQTLAALGKVIWERGVDVEIALSNPGSIPGGLKATEACYGNGWSCVDVAAEIIKTIKKNHPDVTDAELRKKVSENLRVSFIRQKRGQAYDDGKTIGMHAKHFIIDDVCTYIGSQNLYICDLAEWGVVIDDETATKKMMEEYWTPMWESSYTPGDCDVEAVMDGLEVDRDGDEEPTFTSAEEERKYKEALMHGTIVPDRSEKYYDDSDSEKP